MLPIGHIAAACPPHSGTRPILPTVHTPSPERCMLMAMKTARFPITPAIAIVLAAFLALPMHALAQSGASYFGGSAPMPVCVYKGVMTDAEIETCTGFRVRYGYDVYSGGAAAGEQRVTALVRKRTQAPRRKSRNM